MIRTAEAHGHLSAWVPGTSSAFGGRTPKEAAERLLATLPTTDCPECGGNYVGFTSVDDCEQFVGTG